jgi:hypothetical protein
MADPEKLRKAQHQAVVDRRAQEIKDYVAWLRANASNIAGLTVEETRTRYLETMRFVGAGSDAALPRGDAFED